MAQPSLRASAQAPAFEAGGYERRRRAREDAHDLKRRVVFGLGWGWIALLSGAAHVYLVSEANDAAWRLVMLSGAFLLLLSVLLPDALTIPEAWLRQVTQMIGKGVFTLLLSLVYLVLVTPIGAILRHRQGEAPFFAWDVTAPGQSTLFERWTTKPSTSGDARASMRNLPLWLQPFMILSYFIRQGRYLFLPVLVVLLVFGLLMFFVHSSVLAPFIYTLF